MIHIGLDYMYLKCKEKDWNWKRRNVGIQEMFLQKRRSSSRWSRMRWRGGTRTFSSLSPFIVRSSFFRCRRAPRSERSLSSSFSTFAPPSVAAVSPNSSESSISCLNCPLILSSNMPDQAFSSDTENMSDTPSLPLLSCAAAADREFWLFCMFWLSRCSPFPLPPVCFCGSFSGSRFRTAQTVASSGLQT